MIRSKQYIEQKLDTWSEVRFIYAKSTLPFFTVRLGKKSKYFSLFSLNIINKILKAFSNRIFDTRTYSFALLAYIEKCMYNNYIANSLHRSTHAYKYNYI